MYKAIINFTDLQDGKRAYSAGDVYPREGYAPTDERINELLSAENRLGKPVIERAEEEPTEPMLETEEEAPKRRKRRIKDYE